MDAACMRMAGAHQPPQPVEDRLRASADVDRDTGCWLWRLAVDQDGFGSIKVKGRTQYAARTAYETFVGPITPTSNVIYQRCRDRRCVNPDHLEQITRREQIARGESDPLKNFAAYYERRRAADHCPNGHPWDEDNTRWSNLSRGGRQRHCRACLREAASERRSDPAYLEAERERNRERYDETRDHILERKRRNMRARYAAARAEGRCVARSCLDLAAPGRASCEAHLREHAARTWGIKQYPLNDIYVDRGLVGCWLCGGDVSDDDPLWHDHLIPRSLGGPDEVWNFAPAHRSCNIRRRNLPLPETLRVWHPGGVQGAIADVIAEVQRRWSDGGASPA